MTKQMLVMAIAGLLALPCIGVASPDTGSTHGMQAVDTGWNQRASWTNDVDWSCPNDDWYAPPPEPELTPASTLTGTIRVVIWHTPSGMVHMKWFRDPKTQKWYWTKTK